MRKWKQRIISLLLVAAMVFGLAPANVMTVQAAAENLAQADGIIWLTKNEAGDSVSEEFRNMVIGMKLDDMVREALDMQESDDKVYFDGVDVGNMGELLANMGKVNALLDEMKEAITNHELVTFNIGSKNGSPKTIAFRNLTKESVTISAGEENRIYIDHPGAPVDANTLEGMINGALNDTVVSVEHNGVVQTTGFYTPNKARFEASDFEAEGGASFKSLLRKWPTVTVSPDSNVRKAGEVEVTIYAAEYSQKPDAKVTQIFEVYMRDQRVKVNAVAMNGETPVSDSELEGFTAEYSGNADSEPTERPELKHYKFSRWEKDLCEGYHYTAIMEAKTDNNGNGLADQLEEAQEFTVEFYVGEELYHSETVKEGALPVGPATAPVCPEEGEWELNWVADNASWPAFVYENITYHAQWTEIETEIAEDLEVTGVLLSNGKEVRQVLSLVVYSDVNEEYTVADPGWESLVSGGYRCTGWYYKVADGNGEDLNFDGVKNEVPFYMSGDENQTVLKAKDGTVEVFIEFLPVITVNKPATDGSGTVYGDTEEIVVGGSETVEIYSYTIETLDGLKYIQCMDDPSRFDPAEYGVVYDENNSDRLYNFVGWDIDANDYKVTPRLEIVKNDIEANIASMITHTVKDSDRVAYTINGYKSEVSFDGGYVEDDFHTYPLDAETEIVVSPFRNDAEEVLFYVKGLEAYKDGRKIAETEDFDISYDAKYKATFKGVYDAIKAADSKRSVSTEKLSGVILIPQYEPLRLSIKNDAKLLAGQESDFYTEEYIYGQVTGGNYTDEVAEAISIEYRAQEDSYEVSMSKLFDLLEADGLGAVVEQVKEEYNSLPITPPEGHDSIWLSNDVIYADEVTAQELADKYLIEKYEEYKANPGDDSILEFVGNVAAELGTIVYSGAHHKFGYVAPGETNPTEELRITYDSEQICASVTGKVGLEDQRTKTTITAENVLCTYGDNIRKAIMKNVALKADGNTLELSDFAGALFVTYDAANVPRSFEGSGVGTYDVKVGFKGDKDHAPAISDTIKLTVKAVQTTVTVEDLITMEGNMSHEAVSAKVNNDAPIVQIIAGIATDELAFGVNTDGSVKDWKLEFDDKTMMIDVWVKLPQANIDLLSNVDIQEYYPESPIEKIEPGKEYSRDDLKQVLENEGLDNQEQIQSLEAVLNQIPEIVKEKLGISDLTYGLTVRFDALEKKVYPTNSGFYLNYAATLSRFNNIKGTDIVLDKNHTASEDYGFIVMSPMVPIPNCGDVQLYDDKVSNAQNVFVYEYDGEAKPHGLKVAVDGATQKDEAPFYYGLTTRLDATKAAPSMPGVYFAGYNHIETVYNEDSKQDEIKRLGSDSAIIIIKPQEANLTITGGIYEYKEGQKQIADVKITDKNGKEIQGAATVVSGTVNVKDDTTNVSVNDLYGTINVDFPEGLDDKWDKFWESTPYNNKEVVRPGDLIYFLEISRDEAVKAADTVLDEFEKLAMKDAVSDVLDKINGKQDIADVGSDNLVAKAERVREMLNSSVAYYNKLIEQLEPLKDLGDNASLTFYDLETEADKLPYDKTGYYLYVGVITDPELTVDAAKGLVIIHSEDDYVMYDTHVPYDGKPQKFEYKDETGRGDVSVMIDRQANEITFFLDDDVYKAVNTVLESILGKDATLNEGSDANVSTIYKMAENKVDDVTKAIAEKVEAKVRSEIGAKYPATSEALNEALDKVPGKISNLTAKVSSKLQEMDKLPNDTRIIVYNKSNADDTQGMPVNVGTYEFYGYDYDVAATRGKLIIEPIYILVEDTPAWKYKNEADPNLRDYVSVTYYSYKGVAPAVEQDNSVKLPNGVTEADVVEYTISRSDEDKNEVGMYNMTVNATLKNTSGNYVLAPREEDTQDFEIREYGKIGGDGKATLSLKGEVYIEYLPELIGFEGVDLTNKGGLVIYTGDDTPTGSMIYPGKENCIVRQNMYWSDQFDRWAVTTTGINAKKYGDYMYFRPFIKIGEEYIYGSASFYSPKMYCDDKLKNSADEELKEVCASLLEYGAAAQLYFNYKTNSLVNAGCDFSKYDLAYNSNMIDALIPPSSGQNEYSAPNEKVGEAEATLTLEGAVVIEVIYPGVEIENVESAELLVWNEADMANNHDFTIDTESCTFRVPLKEGKLAGKTGYVATLKTDDLNSRYVGIPAKECGDTVYFMAYFVEKGTENIYRSGRGMFSPDEYVRQKAKDDETDLLSNVSKALAVYSEKARKYFK